MSFNTVLPMIHLLKRQYGFIPTPFLMTRKMRCPRQHHEERCRGFTLIEMLVVISILAITSLATIETFRNVRNETSLEDGQATVLYALEGRRSKALSGVGTDDHGVYIESDKITSFEGSSYTPGIGDETYLPSSVSTDQSGTEVVFTRLSGVSSASTTVTFTHTDGTTKTIDITYDGIILPE